MVAEGGVLTPDPEATRPGRGAYVHRDAGCWNAAVRRRGFARALRRNVPDPGARPF
jgi:predicted RNA-binding protein YlxR (DUF448 family)